MANDNIEELKAMFPSYHPEDYTMSIGRCCGSCRKGDARTHFIACPVLHVDMFAYGLCPQYERNADIVYPLVVLPSKPYGRGQG